MIRFLKKDLVFSIILKVVGAALLVDFLRWVLWRPGIHLESYDTVWFWLSNLSLFGLLGMAYIFIRYSSLIAREFGGINKLILFLGLSILAAIITPLLSLLNFACIPIFAITSILITTAMTFITDRLKNRLASWSLTFFFGLLAFAVFYIPFEFAYRHIGAGSVGAGLIVLAGAILTSLVSMVVNVIYKIKLIEHEGRT